MTTSEKEMFDYLNAEKGYDGELMFDQLTDKLHGERIVLKDLLLKTSSTYFQIDSVIISQWKVDLFEVKNYEGDYFSESGKFFKVPKREVKNPFNQLERNTSLMRQWLNQHGFQIEVKGWVTFVNPEFSLFQAPLNFPVILPSQLNRFMRNLDLQPSRLNNIHKKIAETLISNHHEKSPYTQLPAYELGLLKKLISCPKCLHFMILMGRNKCICNNCSYIEKINSSVLRIVGNHQLLFPSSKNNYPRNISVEWWSCG
ncbi:nuclease-related domain-containing protein [Neobacillus mesonae]|uniref:nuclease-related domain-containing protein n=1 Tax=Neobacillus mesonae TaxID=1193713 RepID=UPI00203CC2BD|nr:nuclease-related domain-containing protein [Neobacillus mesonae]MCM3570748.1 NERD domain-containing protein [Neobacillus mesonae]